MFERPAKKDIDHALSILMHEAHRQTLDEKNRIFSEATLAGALQSSRVVVIVADAADKIHTASMKQATRMLRDFVERMETPATEIAAWSRPHLENLSNSVLGVIPPNGFPADYQRITNQYRAVFKQRVDGTLRDVEIGYVRGAGFSVRATMSEEEWISAAAALALLGMNHHVATRTICKRAHAGLIKARAARFIHSGQPSDNVDVPSKFWWADGGAALQQNWTTGDFETWTAHQCEHLKAFGVSFLRVDIEKMIPAMPSEKVLTGAPKGRGPAIILTALDVETRAVLRHLSGVHEKTVRGTVFHVGQFDEWVVAVAECGEGNVHAAATVERGIAHFHPEVALFVGIAGGVKDVSIGDALVSSKVYGYEHGKDTGAGFKQRPVVNLPAYTLEQRARAVKLREDWRKRLNSSLPHSNPEIYIGAIAAGEKVVASSAGKIAEFLKENYGDALGVEMEGQGFLAGAHINAVQGCVIRGISDLLDGKAEADKAGSQKQAADVASAVAFEMLATLQPAGAERTSADTHGQLPDIRHEKNDLIAIGPGIVFTGEFLGIDNDEWSFHLRSFVDGDVHTLIAFTERYDQTAAIDRYVLVNFLGDGRVLKSRPSMTRENSGGYIIRCPVLPSADRIRAADLPKDLALSENHGLTATIAMVSGLEALPQLVKTCLSHQKGESPFHRDFGTRFAEYYSLLSGSPWFERFLKLEVIRQAAIPYIDTIMSRQDTPLQCVERVYGIEILANAPTDN